jgi:hypothetical protein
MKPLKLIALRVCSLSLLSGNQYVLADDGQWGTEETPLIIDWVGSGSELDLEHVDADPWKGWATIYLKNWCGGDWGDFHLKIKGYNIANVDFSETVAPQLWVKQGYTWVRETGITWDVDNVVVGAELDMYFYDSPITHGETAMIKVYTDNTYSRCSSFRICAYPTPVPEPAALGLLALGTGLYLLRRKA